MICIGFDEIEIGDMFSLCNIALVILVLCRYRCWFIIFLSLKNSKDLIFNWCNNTSWSQQLHIACWKFKYYLSYVSYTGKPYEATLRVLHECKSDSDDILSREALQNYAIRRNMHANVVADASLMPAIVSWVPALKNLLWFYLYTL